MNQKVIKINETDNYRIIAISDIHGHVDHLKSILPKLNLKATEYLIIIGDFINKGPNSFKTYQLIKELSKRERTFILKGNHEYMIHSYLEQKDEFYKLYGFLKEIHYETIIHSLLNAKGMTMDHFNASDELYDYLHKHHEDMINFLSNLPIIADFNDYKFVHGGYNQEFSMETEEVKFLKYDNYNELSGINEKTVVVGHWPSCIFNMERISNQPYHNKKKHIIFIDGGLGVKKTGQLNAFEIVKNNGHVTYDLIQEDHFTPQMITKDSEFTIDDTDKIYINYPHYAYEILSKGEKMSTCRHVHTGRIFTVFNSLILKTEKGYRLKTNYVNNFLEVNKGDMVNIVAAFEEFVLVKYKEDFGWITPDLIDSQIIKKQQTAG